MRTAISVLCLSVLAACRSSSADAGAGTPNTSGSAKPTIAVLEVVKVVAHPLDTTVHLEGELSPYESVAVYARVTGFVSRVSVDRGTSVKKGQMLVTLVAPELHAQRAEAEAKLIGDTATFERLKAAAETPGAVAGDEVERSRATVRAGQARLDALRDTERYLSVTAPFEGVITERNVHPGALVGPTGGAISSVPMLRLEQVKKLRLTVPVPEALVGAIVEGSAASFTVRAVPGAKFPGTVKRIARSVDVKTRSMAVELDVDNSDERLAPGMFAEVLWPVKRKNPSLFVPPLAIVQSTESTFVARIVNGVVDQVPVQRGATQGDLVEVFGALHEGDRVARRGSEELRSGMHVEVRVPPPSSSGDR